MAMVDTVVMVDTMVDTVDTEARGPLMPNPRLRLMPLLNPKLMLMPGDTTAMDVLMDTMVDTMDIPTVISAKDLLMPNLRLMLMLGGTDTVDTMVMDVLMDTDTVTTEEKGPLKLNPSPTTDTDIVDTDTVVTDTVDTVDTIMVELLKIPLKLPSGSSHSISFNLATIPSIF